MLRGRSFRAGGAGRAALAGAVVGVFAAASAATTASAAAVVLGAAAVLRAATTGRHAPDPTCAGPLRGRQRVGGVAVDRDCFWTVRLVKAACPAPGKQAVKGLLAELGEAVGAPDGSPTGAAAFALRRPRAGEPAFAVTDARPFDQQCG